MTTRDSSPKRKTSGRCCAPEVQVCDPNISIVPTWAMGGQASVDRRPSHDPAERSADRASDGHSDAAATARCYTKQTLTSYLGLSVRSLDRANALGLLPSPDLIVGRSPRWSTHTIERWLRTHPRLPGRKGGAA